MVRKRDAAGKGLLMTVGIGAIVKGIELAAQNTVNGLVVIAAGFGLLALYSYLIEKQASSS